MAWLVRRRWESDEATAVFGCLLKLAVEGLLLELPGCSMPGDGVRVGDIMFGAVAAEAVAERGGAGVAWEDMVHGLVTPLVIV